MSRRPWAAITFALALLIVTTLPYLLAWGQQSAGWRFSGFLFGAEDGQSYLAKMRQGAMGELEFMLPYTTEPHDAAPGVFLAYLLPGWLIGRTVPESNPALTGALIIGFHALRLAGAIVYLAVLYRFISAFVLTPGLRLLAFALATIGGGVGWLLSLTGGWLAPEFYIPEGFSLLILWGLPHLLLARSALLGGLLLLFRAAEDDRAWRWAIGSALCWSVMGMIVPFYLAALYALLAAWIGLVWWRARAFPRRLFSAAVMGGGLTLLVFVYFALAFAGNPMLAAWSNQNLLPSPPPGDLLLAYLPLLVPALTALPFIWSAAWDKGRLTLLLAWVIIAPLLAYFPIGVQRRLLEGVIVPLAILAAVGLAGWARHGRAGRWLAAGIVVLACLSTAFLLVGGASAALRPGLPLFRPAAEVAAFDWLNARAERGEVALGAFATGNALPAATHLRPLVGHGPETIAAQAKRALVEAFYRDELSADERAALLAGPCLAPAPLPCSDPIDYVLFGPLEQVVAGSTTPGAWAEGLTLMYSSAGYAIYAVTGDQDG